MMPFSCFVKPTQDPRSMQITIHAVTTDSETLFLKAIGRDARATWSKMQVVELARKVAKIVLSHLAKRRWY